MRDHPSPPPFLRYVPTELAFGTSGLRGLVRDMTDLEVGINVRGFLAYLQERGEMAPGESVALARDLRETDPSTGQSSSPRIARAVVRAVTDDDPGVSGGAVLHCGQIPTPALACYAMAQGRVGIMVTGSHIPADRNGVKFFKKSGEVLKSDEAGILAAVARVRVAEYARTAEVSAFDADGMLKTAPALPSRPFHAEAAAQHYRQRYLGLFAGERPLAGMRLVVYQHSAVGRDLLVEILEALGASVTPVDRSETFVSIDTEEVRPADDFAPAAISG